MSLQRTATVVSSFTAFLLLVIKFIVWIISWSIAVLSSAIDSLMDMFVSIFNYFAVKNAEKEADSKFNYGRGKIEALASLIEWVIITFSWIYIFYESVMKFITKEEVSYLWIWVAVMLISVVLTWALVYYLEYVAKKTNNLVIKSDALHYKTDLYSNAWILIWLAAIYFTGLHYIDAIIWLIISVYIVYSAWELIEKWFLLLMDHSIDKREVQQIVDIVKSHKPVTSYHELKTREVGNTKFVEIHLVFNPEILLVDAHRIWDHIEAHIEDIDKKSDWKIIVHLDPYDDSGDIK
jgi:ferrous-iron efflux pump FieF